MDTPGSHAKDLFKTIRVFVIIANCREDFKRVGIYLRREVIDMLLSVWG